MLRKIGLGLFSAAALFASTSIAMTHDLSSNLSMDIDLDPNKPELLTNASMMDLKAACVMQTADDKDVIHIRAVRKSGSVNGQYLNEGDTLDIDVHNGEKISLTAKKTAQVELTNKGEHRLKAKCKA